MGSGCVGQRDSHCCTARIGLKVVKVVAVSGKSGKFSGYQQKYCINLLNQDNDASFYYYSNFTRRLTMNKLSVLALALVLAVSGSAFAAVEAAAGGATGGATGGAVAGGAVGGGAAVGGAVAGMTTGAIVGTIAVVGAAVALASGSNNVTFTTVSQ